MVELVGDWDPGTRSVSFRDSGVKRLREPFLSIVLRVLGSLFNIRRRIVYVVGVVVFTCDNLRSPLP